MRKRGAIIKAGETVVLDNTSEIRWKCSECGNVQDNNWQCKKCGAAAQAFDEVKVVIPNENRVDVEVLENVIYEDNHCEKGAILSLSTTDPKLASLLERKLVKKIKKKVE